MSRQFAPVETRPAARGPAAPPPPRHARGRPRPAWRGRAGRAGVSVLLWGYAAAALLPLLMMVGNSLRPNADVLADPLGLPLSPTLDNYATAWSGGGFARAFGNSLLVTILAVLLGTVVSLLAAYPLGRYRFRGSGLLTAYFLSGLMLPIRLGVLPIYYLLASLGLLDSLTGLILVYAASGIPFSVFIMAGFFRGLPIELEEAARIDGANEFRIFSQVMVPLTRPAIATVVVFQFVPLWNDFFFPLVLLRSSENATIMVQLAQFFGQFETNWSLLFAGLVIATVPLVCLFLLATKQIVTGLTAGMNR
jgi:raffinose/stachyose/melibiose transport system permease protein